MFSMQRNRRFLLVLIACLGIAVVSWVALRGEPQPMSEGVELSRWIEAYDPMSKDEAKARAPLEAVRRIGTNAVPFLVKWI